LLNAKWEHKNFSYILKSLIFWPSLKDNKVFVHIFAWKLNYQSLQVNYFFELRIKNIHRTFLQIQIYLIMDTLLSKSLEKKWVQIIDRLVQVWLQKQITSTAWGPFERNLWKDYSRETCSTYKSEEAIKGSKWPRGDLSFILFRLARSSFERTKSFLHLNAMFWDVNHATNYGHSKNEEKGQNFQKHGHKFELIKVLLERLIGL